jgi:hypothetical protein
MVCYVSSGNTGKDITNARRSGSSVASTPKLAYMTAWSAKGPWKMSHTPGVRMALYKHFFDGMGLLRLSAHCKI